LITNYFEAIKELISDGTYEYKYGYGKSYDDFKSAHTLGNKEICISYDSGSVSDEQYESKYDIVEIEDMTIYVKTDSGNNSINDIKKIVRNINEACEFTLSDERYNIIARDWKPYEQDDKINTVFQISVEIWM